LDFFFNVVFVELNIASFECGEWRGERQGEIVFLEVSFKRGEWRGELMFVEDCDGEWRSELILVEDGNDALVT